MPWAEFEEVWLTPDGAAQGLDDVVEAAVAWIESQDLDNDGIINAYDNCPDTYNPDQADTTHDGIGDACCCFGIRGNINGDIDEGIDISDLTKMVAYMFKGDPIPPPCPDEYNVNGDSSDNIADLTHLVAYMFKEGPEPVSCP
jgi:hypothetical protein